MWLRWSRPRCRQRQQLGLRHEVLEWARLPLCAFPLRRPIPWWGAAVVRFVGLLIAEAAYEQDDDNIPKADALTTAPGRWDPMTRSIPERLAQAWTTPEMLKPRASGQSVAQNISHPVQSPWAISSGSPSCSFIGDDVTYPTS